MRKLWEKDYILGIALHYCDSMQESEILAKRLEVGSDIISATVEFFHKEGFIQLLPVLLGKSTDPLGPDPGSSVIKTAEVEYLGDRLRLMNSMILHKQVAIRELGRKVWILSPNIRLEKAERGGSRRHLFEFTQADFEIPNGKKEDIMGLMERYFMHLSRKLDGTEALKSLGVEPFKFKTPFKVYTTHELASKYGEDWEPAASMAEEQPFFAMCHKREFYDKEDEEHLGHYLNYDLIYPKGYGEGLSGAEREYDTARIYERMGRDKLQMDIYAAYLSEAKKGFVPSAGGGFGMERLIRFITGACAVGDVQMFRRVPGEEVRI